MTTKVVRSLKDLEDALALAAGQGECLIKVGNRVAMLVVSEPLDDEEADALLKDPEVARRLSQAARSLDEGKGIAHADVLQRLGHGKR